MQIEIDPNSGFCFGVVRAIELAEHELGQCGTLLCLGDIVHNGAEVQRLESAEIEKPEDSTPDSLASEKIEIATEEKTEDVAIENSSEIVDSNPVAIATPENPAPAVPTTPVVQPEIPQPARNSSEPTLAEIEEELRRKRQQLSIPGRE